MSTVTMESEQVSETFIFISTLTQLTREICNTFIHRESFKSYINLSPLQVTLQCPWTPEEMNIVLHFQPPLMSSFRLHTAHTRKFVQIVVVGLNIQMLELSEPTLTVTGNEDIRLGSLNPTSGQKLASFCSSDPMAGICLHFQISLKK